MKNPLIIFNPNADSHRLNEIKKAISWLSITQKFNIVEKYLDVLDVPQLKQHSGVSVFDKEQDAIRASDSILSLGGDGTVLYCVKALAGMSRENFFDLPIIPVNFGTVGFICPFTLDDLYSKEVYNHEISERSLLFCNGYYTALNEIAMVKDDHGIRKFKIQYNGQDVAEFRADGCIFSTATGSTAYSFSCSGPILFPGSGEGSISITPIAPIDASLRPIVIPFRERDRVRVYSENTRCIVDGAPKASVSKMNITMHSQKLKLATPKNFNYFNLLKEKLGWSRLEH